MIFLRAYATIPEFLNSLFNTAWFPDIPINTYGTFVAIGFMMAAIMASKELTRRGELGLIPIFKTTEIIGAKPSFKDLWFPGFFWFIIGFKFVGALINNHNLLTDGQNTVSYLLSTQGYLVWGLLFAAAGVAYNYYKLNKKAIPTPKEVEVDIKPQDLIGELVFVAAFFGVVGASVFELIQPKSTMTLRELFSDPMNFLSGLTIYGGLTFGIIGVTIYALYRKIKPFQLFDALSPGFILAMAFGRMGCHFSGDGDWGIVNTKPSLAWLPDYFWSNTYAHNVINEGVEIAGCTGKYCHVLPQGVYPTAIYEILMFLCFCHLVVAAQKSNVYARLYVYAYVCGKRH